MADRQDLKERLAHIDGRGYKAYKELRGNYGFGDFELQIDHVQGDPFAAPSRLRVHLPQARAGFPPHTFAGKSRTVALCTYLARRFSSACRRHRRRRGSGKSGLIDIDTPGQQILERTCVLVNTDEVEVRFVLGLPADGRRVSGMEATVMLCEDVPRIVTESLIFEEEISDSVDRFVEVCEDADYLRGRLADLGLIAFVADGSLLPRRSGIDDRPLEDGLTFESPAEQQIEIELPNAGPVTGMGIRRGVTLIVGGGFHGKSTLLNAIERGVYNHLPGDGREFVVTDAGTCKIRAEDGRSVAGLDLSSFIGELPFGRNTEVFSTTNASGSTSQAANILESLEVGCTALLIDEDTAATNFMIRDARMQQLIPREKEPITPFIDRTRQLYEKMGVSSVIVVGGSGDYLEVADTVIAMESYRPHDLTIRAREILAAHPTDRNNTSEADLSHPAPRIPSPASIDPRRGRREDYIRTHGLHEIRFGAETIDLGAVGQLVDPSQTRAIAAAIAYAGRCFVDGTRTLGEIVHLVQADIRRDGLDVLSSFPVGDLALFRGFELAAAVNRLRTLQIQRPPP